MSRVPSPASRVPCPATSGTVPPVRLLLVLVALALVGSACGSATPDQVVFGGDRPTELAVPTDYRHGTETPLLVALHGYGSSGAEFAEGSGLAALAEAEGALFLAPDGTIDARENRFWNGSDACCDFADTGIDDVGYIADLVAEVAEVYTVDPDRVHVVGFSNGAFLTHRIACERPDVVASVAALAGAVPTDSSACDPAEPVSVLLVHGDDDRVIDYDGGGAFFTRAPYPGAIESRELWADDLGCGPVEDVGRLDLLEFPGEETAVTTHPGCDGEATVTLWTAEAVNHRLPFTDDGLATLWAWLADHAA